MGLSGYDPSMEDMRGIFLAQGPGMLVIILISIILITIFLITIILIVLMLMEVLLGKTICLRFFITDFKNNGEEVAPMELVDVYQVKYITLRLRIQQKIDVHSLNHPIFAGFSLCAENPSESTQRHLVARPGTSPWGAWFSSLLKSRPHIDTPGCQPGSPKSSPIAKGCSLKVILRQFAVTLMKHSQRHSLSISRRFSLKRVTCFCFRHWAPIFLLSPFAQTVVKFAFKKDQRNALKVCYSRTWKNSNDGELANQTFQWKMINGAMYVTLPMEFYTDL